MPGFQFSETMRGYFLEDTDDPRTGYRFGREMNNWIEVNLTIKCNDLDAFINDPKHQTRLEGTINSNSSNIGRNIPITNGVFNLFRVDEHRDMSKIIYRFEFSSQGGRSYLFYGQKEIRKDYSFILLPRDIKNDITTLFTTIYHYYGNTRGQSMGAGILRFRIRDSWRWFRSINPNPSGSSLYTKMKIVLRFLCFAIRELTRSYRRGES